MVVLGVCNPMTLVMSVRFSGFPRVSCEICRVIVFKEGLAIHWSSFQSPAGVPRMLMRADLREEWREV